MMKDLDKLYEERQKDLTFEICFIEGIQYNFKLDDIKKMLKVNTKEDLQVFKKYLYYLDVYRCNNEYIESLDVAMKKFEEIFDEDELDKVRLLEMFKKHETIFCDSSGMMKLKLVPRDFDVRIFSV